LVRSDNLPFKKSSISQLLINELIPTFYDLAKHSIMKALDIGQPINGHQHSTFHNSSSPLPLDIEVYTCRGFDELMGGNILENYFSGKSL